MKVYIVDDQKELIDSLIVKLNDNVAGVKISGYSHTAKDAFIGITNEKPDIVFLDIDLGEESGFDLLDLFKSITFKIIFVTAHNDFAIKAIKYAALDYLLKPINVKELVDAIEKARLKISEEQNIDFLKNQLKNNNDSGKIILDSGAQSYIVRFDDIIYCEVLDNYVTVYIQNQKPIKLLMQLKEVEELLPPNFIKCHRSYLINKNFITKVDRSGNEIYLSNEKKIPLSPLRRDVFFKLIGFKG